MSLRCRLVFLPGQPFSIKALCPQLSLAAIAGALRAGGHEVDALDYGTLQALDRMRGTDRGAGKCAWKYFKRDQAGAAQAGAARATDIARAILRVCPPDMAVFIVETLPGAVASHAVVRVLREWAPEMPIAFAGAHASHYAEALAANDICDAVFVGDLELAVLQFAGRLHDRSRWGELPNVVSAHTHAAPMRSEVAGDWNAVPAPCFDPEACPSLQSGGKLKLWPVEHCRGAHHLPWGQPQQALRLRQARTKSALRICEEMSALARVHGARAYQVLGEGTPAAQADSLSYELLARGARVVYSREAHIRRIDPATVEALAASGCRALSFQLDTGSQRLLDDFYGHDFTVSEAETVLKACGAANLFVATQWTYPCPADDWHTREETLRLLSRTRPGAAFFRTAKSLPQSMWALRPGPFGFVDGADALARNAVRCWRGETAPEDSAGARMSGWRPAQIAGERELVRTRTEELGIACDVDARGALLAQVAGFAGREAEFVAGLNHALEQCDAEAAARFVDAFNAAAKASPAVLRLEPFQPLRAAVGN